MPKKQAFAKGGLANLAKKNKPADRAPAQGGAQVVIRQGKDGKLKVFARMPKGHAKQLK
jgi:hypothetical protein